MIDLSAFYRDDRAGEYEVEVEVRATVYETVKAGSPEDARLLVEQMLENNEIDVCGSDFDRARIVHSRKTPPMFCITRPGTNITGTTRPEPGDEPRLPREYESGAYKPEPA